MRKVHILYIACMMLFSMNCITNAQVKQPEYKVHKPSVAVIARSKGDSVLIRWAPDDPMLWQLGNQYGYRVIRIKVAEDDRFLFGNDRITVIVADSVRPFPVSKIEPLADKDKYAAIVGQAIYGEDFEVSASFEKGPADILNKARELQNRFSFALFSADQSALAARVHGLWFTDKDVKIGDKYLYEVYPLLPAGQMEFDTAYTVISVNDTAQLPKPYDLKATFGDKFVQLSWNREYLQRFYTSYFVERSDDGGKTYAATTESPFLNLSENPDEASEYILRVDSLPQNDKVYYYRVRGISPFGETGPPSDVVSGSGISKVEFTNPIITKNEILNGITVKIEWEIQEELAAEIYGFEVSRAGKSEGPFTTISIGTLDKQVRSFTDPLPLKAGYYRVASIDKTGEKHYSFPSLVLMPDSIPPAVPVNLKGTVDSTGIVTLSWDANNEDDLAGYRIFRSNQPDDGYVKINDQQITSTTFRDTLSLRVLTKKVYYRIAAIDNHYNESGHTVPLTIIRPDTIPPAPPSFKNFAVTDSSIIIYWNKSPSEDVKDHLLYRRKAGETQWQRVNPINDTTSLYNDMDITHQAMYQYLVLAKDETGLESEPGNPLQVRANGVIKPVNAIVKFKADINRAAKTIELTWETLNTQTIAKYEIYRSINAEPLILYKTIESPEKSFTDDNVTIGISYTYRIQAISISGAKFLLSNGLKIEF